MNSIIPGPDPIAEPIARLIELFGAHAEALCFPEVDHSTLHADAEAVRHAAAEVARCERALAEARDQLEERRDELRARASRGLAYARIFAEDDPELLGSLTDIELSPRRRAAPKRAAAEPRRRGRPRKVALAEDGVTELPFADDETDAVRLDAAAGA